MSVYDFFDESLCIIYDENNSDTIERLSNFGIRTKPIYSTSTELFNTHVKILQHAFESHFNNIVVFEDNVLPKECYTDEFMKDIVASMKDTDVDLIFLSHDTFNNPTTGVIVYKKKAFEKILFEYEDYINIMDYKTYLLKYSEVNHFKAQPFLFCNDTLLERLSSSPEVKIFFLKYYILFIICVVAFLVKKYLQKSVIKHIKHKI